MGQAITCIEDDASLPLHPGPSPTSMSPNPTAAADQWVPQWQNHLARLQRSFERALLVDSSSATSSAHIFHALLQLYAHKDVIRRLGELAETEGGQKALTFYIPQLTTFLVHGGFEEGEERERKWERVVFWVVKAVGGGLERERERDGWKGGERQRHKNANIYPPPPPPPFHPI